MEETMQHIEEVEREEQMQENDTKTTNTTVNGAGNAIVAVGGDREAAPTSNNSTTKLAGMYYLCTVHYIITECWGDFNSK